MKFSRRLQIGLIALGFILVLAHWMYAIHLDKVWIATDPVEASGGMAAFSVALSDFFHTCFLMAPTVWLIWVMAGHETVYTAYSRFLFWLSITLPVLLAVCPTSPKLFGDPLIFRLMASPFVFLGIGFSRWTARFDLAKKLTFRALVIEGAAFGVAVVLFFAGVL